MDPKSARAFSTHRIFVDYYDDAEPATSVEEVEAWAKLLMDKDFEDEEYQEDYLAGYLMYQIVQMVDPAELPAVLASDYASVRDIACKRYMFLVHNIKHTGWYIDVWNYVYRYNGETHGTIMGMCCKGSNEELHALGVRVWKDLEQIRGGDPLYFDT